MLLYDLELARRLEAAHVRAGVLAVEADRELDPEAGASWEPCGHGALLYCGVKSPLTHALGVGVGTAVSDDDLDRVDAFFGERGAPAEFDLCPHAETSLPGRLHDRGYRPHHFENVLVRKLTAGDLAYEVPAGLVIAEASPEDIDVHAGILADAFGQTAGEKRALRAVGRTTFAMRGGIPVIASIDGQPVGVAMLQLNEGVATVSGGATLPAFRRRGIQSALLSYRLARATQSGADLAMVAVLPGSASSRNVARVGFHPVYTRTVLVNQTVVARRLGFRVGDPSRS